MRQRPNFLKAKTKEELVVLMDTLLNLYKLDYIHFYDFQFAQGEWVCWYEIPKSKELEQKLRTVNNG